jgi:hypothetical protein
MLTESHADNREDDELGDDEECKVSGDDCAVQTRVRLAALVLGQRAHDLRQNPTEQGRHGRRQDTGDNVECLRVSPRPRLQKRDLIRELG